MVGRVEPPAVSAVTRSGSACASAPNRQSMMRYPVMPRAPHGDGKSGLTREPSGAVTVIGTVKPWQLGMSETMTERRAA